MTTITLDNNKAATLGTGDVTIKMCEGTGWIVLDKVDTFIQAGERLVLTDVSEPVIISSAKWNERVVFNVSTPVQSRSPRKQVIASRAQS